MDMNPRCQFFRFFHDARPPQRADRFSSGTLPMRAAQYCDAITSASSFGWWLFCPVDAYVVWDGRSIVWSADGEDYQAVDDCVHFPGFPEAWNAEAPEHLAGLCPPFLTALPEPGLIQISLGLFARTAQDWLLSLRRPPNYPLPGHIEHFDGIVDTSRWMGPLFINLRLSKTDVPIRLRADMPLAQAQPLPRGLLAPDVLRYESTMPGPDEWEGYRVTVAEPTSRAGRGFGAYAMEERRAQRRSAACPIMAA